MKDFQKITKIFKNFFYIYNLNEIREMRLKKIKLESLIEAEDYCIRENLNVEFMIEFMQDFAEATMDEVLYYLENIEDLRRDYDLKRELNNY